MIKILNVIDDSVYDEISDFKNLSFYHSKHWHNVLSDAFNWNVSAIVLLSQKKVIAFLPFINKRRLISKKNICLPLSHQVGIAYEKKFIDSIDEVLSFIEETFLSFEIHSHLKTKNLLNVHKNYITHLDLKKYDTTNSLFKSLDYKSIRYMINKAKKNDVFIDSSFSKKLFVDFYELELLTRHQQGAPIYPENFFELIFDNFKYKQDSIGIRIAYINDAPISGSIILYSGKIAIYGYSASTNDRAIKKLGANELVLWESIESAFNKGYTIFDFGTTPKHLTGLLKYKEKWGGESTILNYSFLNKKNVGNGSVNRESKIVLLISNVLKKLPVGLFKKISPYLLKNAV